MTPSLPGTLPGDLLGARLLAAQGSVAVAVTLLVLAVRLRSRAREARP